MLSTFPAIFINWQITVIQFSTAFPTADACMAMEMDNIELVVELQVFTHIHDHRAVHRQFIPDTQ